MIAMIFEYWLNQEHLEEYIPTAIQMRRMVDEIDGFISFERFKSADDPRKLLGLGFFRDEEAVRAWRCLPEHRQAQLVGREKFFTDYRLRMAEVSRDYGLNQRDSVPDDSRVVQETPLSE
jgi:heme-degrading monooxygenase HmoA